MLSARFFRFFAELERNNTREWFHDHATEFKEHVQAPFLALIEQLLSHMQSRDSLIAMSAKDALFRIHRDVRFAKNKAPYKTAMGAAIGRGGRKDMAEPGLYIEAHARGGHIAGGIYMPSREQLADIRSWIADHHDELDRAVNDPAFVQAFGTLRGERSKVMPAEFRDVVASAPLIVHKQLYYWGDITKQDLLAADAAERIMAKHDAAAHVNDVLRRALHGQ
ncbi:MAG: DUF2461 domain-containing protein [Candidatus Kapabacteria bacterium]|nr:DUF2461 domain-containing protein [Candidatus Kapabacteria bacterium]